MGGLALCKAAKGALMLQRLVLSNNALTDVVVIGMADAIRFNTGTLKEVAVAGCKAREDAAVQLIKAAYKNTTLQLLDIRGIALAHEVRRGAGRGGCGSPARHRPAMRPPPHLPTCPCRHPPQKSLCAPHTRACMPFCHCLPKRRGA